MEKLFGVPQESYCAEYGSMELPPMKGKPEVFVIGGNGSGIPVYRRLQRQGIPFAAGILHENDLDYPVAKALAVQVISERPYEAIQQETYEAALGVLKDCRSVICCAKAFGTINRKTKSWPGLRRRREKCKPVQNDSKNSCLCAATENLLFVKKG